MRRIYYNISRDAAIRCQSRMGSTRLDLPVRNSISYKLPLVSEKKAAKPFEQFEKSLDKLVEAIRAFELNVKGLQEELRKDDAGSEKKSNRQAAIAGSVIAGLASLAVGTNIGYPMEIWAPVVLVAVPIIAFALYKFEEHASRNEKKKLEEPKA